MKSKGILPDVIFIVLLSLAILVPMFLKDFKARKQESEARSGVGAYKDKQIQKWTVKENQKKYIATGGGVLVGYLLTKVLTNFLRKK